MTHCGPEFRQRRTDWDRTGTAAEEFARRIARDAQRFGERVAEHANGFAREISREWRHGPGFDTKPMREDVRGMLKEVRGLIGDVIDGVDELIGRIFHPGPEEATNTWSRVVTNREVGCIACGRRIGPGEECHLHRRAEGREFRCADCGPPAPDAPPAA
jgi:hypothetical protein